ncbi:HAMP domain-containing histidine kinase [Solitalea sp. MAHUQ-68]|uniref:histidine kinase n=1 Tax=Solitalea agri TaxID=2953739 RepID=A0A9X2JBF0_9SPHI|nr:HAMP domain-containing sensor histidine kinase [Solitalea agri]MCO4291339.1 HAMP domain-containing histidine kinase [Solitalea agri]
MLRKFFSKLLSIIAGDNNKFSLENRIFNITCIVTILLAFGAIVLNLINNIDWRLNIIIIITETGIIILYYLSRFKHKFQSTVVAFISLCYIGLGIGWFYNSGSQGPVIYIITFFLIVFISIINIRYRSYWIFSCVAFTVSLFVIEYYHPEWVDNYQSRENRFIDLIGTYLLVMISIVTVVLSIRNNYEYERKKAQRHKEEITLQNQLISQQYKNLENQDLIKIKVFSIISHDLRGPLTSLQGLLNLFNEKLIGTEEFTELSTEITERVRHNLQLLDNLLYWSNSQMLGLKVEAVEIVFNNMMDEFLHLLKPEAESKHIIIENNINGEVSAYADINMVKVVIRNLLSNAIKFTRPFGKIKISCRNDGEAAIFSVEDNGVGISSENQMKLFSMDHFSTKGTANEIGTGLGLILCKDFIERNGGKIWTISELGKGSVFSFSLPRFKVFHSEIN